MENSFVNTKTVTIPKTDNAESSVVCEKKVVNMQPVLSGDIDKLSDTKFNLPSGHNEDDRTNETVSCSIIYNNSHSNSGSFQDKPSVCVKKIKVNTSTFVDFHSNDLLKPRTFYVVAKNNVNEKSCLHIESKKNVCGMIYSFKHGKKSNDVEVIENDNLPLHDLEIKAHKEVDKSYKVKVGKSSKAKVDESSKVKFDEQSKVNFDESSKVKVGESSKDKFGESSKDKVGESSNDKVGESSNDKVDESTLVKFDESSKVKFDESSKAKVDDIEAEIPLDKDMFSLLNAFESTEGISKIFKFPNKNECTKSTKEVSDANEEHAQIYKNDVKLVEQLTALESVSSKPKASIAEYFTDNTDHVYCYNQKVTRKMGDTKQVRNRLLKKRKRSNTRKQSDPVNNLNKETSKPTLRPYKKLKSNRRRVMEARKTISTDLILLKEEEYNCPESEVLEYVFKYESFPGSNYMRILAKNMKVSWKIINNWFMNRRSEAKKNGMVFRTKEFSHCIYCDPLTERAESSIEHLSTITHINNVKRAFYIRIEGRNNILKETSPNIISANTQEHTPVPATDIGVTENKLELEDRKNNANDAYNHISNKCTKCASYFPNKWTLVKHSIIHRDILCHLCNKTISHSEYKKHVISHMTFKNSKKLSRYCECRVCHQIDCECGILDSSPITCNIKNCECFLCANLENELDPLVHSCQVCNKVKCECDSLDLLPLNDETICRKCNTKLCECERLFASPTYDNIRVVAGNLFINYCQSSDYMCRIWTSVKEQEDNGRADVIVPSPGKPNSARNKRNLSGMYPSIDQSNYKFPPFYSKYKSKQKCFIRHGLHLGCISKVGIFQELTPIFGSQLVSRNGVVKIDEDFYSITSKHETSNSTVGDNIGRNNEETFCRSNVTEACEYSEGSMSNCSPDIGNSLPLEKVNFNADSFTDYCLICHRERFSSRDLLLHTSVHWDIEKEFICNKCGVHLLDFRDCIEHIFKHLKIALYACHYCTHRFYSHRNIIQHLAIDHSFIDIDEHASYNWVADEEAQLPAVNEEENNRIDENLSFECETFLSVPDNIDGAIENVVMEDSINDTNNCQNSNEEVLDISEIPDNIEDIGELFETVVLSDNL